MAGTGVANLDGVGHADAVVIREPVFAGDLAGGETENFVEGTGWVGKDALAGEDLYAVGGNYFQRAALGAHPARGNAPAGQDGEGAVGRFDAANQNIDNRGLGGAGVANQHPHAHGVGVDVLDVAVVVSREPVIGGELAGGYAHDFVVALARGGALAGEDRLAVSGADIHRPGDNVGDAFGGKGVRGNIQGALVDTADGDISARGAIVVGFAAGKAAVA